MNKYKLHVGIACIVSLCTCLLLCAGCKKKEPAPPSSALLEPGKGVVMVVFGRTADFQRDDWMAQIFLDGESDTRSLPRIPMSDVQTIVVPNVLPGFYHITAHAWIRGTSPSAGGARDSVEVRAGKVTVLKARAVGLDPFPYTNTPLDFVRMETWTLVSQSKLHEYVTTLIQKPSNQ